MITLVLDIVTTAAILFIVSAGLLIVFGVMKIINFAHASFITVGAYTALVASRVGLPPVLAPRSGLPRRRADRGDGRTHRGTAALWSTA